MIRLLRRYSVEALKQFFLEKKGRAYQSRLGSSRGQIALVLILLAAIGLVLYAVILRYQPVSQTRARTMMGAQKAASGMASFMASYANRLSHEYLRGGLRYCKSTSILKAILMVIVMVIAVIVVSWCSVFQLTTPVVVALAALMFSVLALSIDYAVIQPGITNMWNRMMSKMSMEDQLIERGLQDAFLIAVNDNQPFPDFLDHQGTGAPAKVGDWESSEITRFSFYYTQRLIGIENPINLAIEEFAKQLRRFVLVQENPPPVGSNAPVWGLHDPLELNPCDSSFDFYLGGHNLRDECTLSNKHELEEGGPAVAGGVQGTCTGSRCFYDPFFEFVGNSYFSFREQMGRDAERPFGVYRTGPSGAPYDYRVQDISGWDRLDPRKRRDGGPAVYLPLYMMDDLGVSLPELRSHSEDYRYHCFWTHRGCSNPYGPADPFRNPSIPALEPLMLPRMDSVALQYSGGLSARHMGFSNSVNDDTLGAPLGSLTYVDLLGPPILFFPDDRTACGHLGDGTARLRWKRGIDRFCSSEYPYDMECSKHAGCTDPESGEAVDCVCTDVSGLQRRFFPEDFFDDIFYVISEFVKWAQVFLYAYNLDDGGVLDRDFETWYDLEAADWFERACTESSCSPGDPSCCPGSYTKQNREGYLRVLDAHMLHIYYSLGDWYAGEDGWHVSEGSKMWGGVPGDGYAAWCVPPEGGGTRAEIPQSERDTFGSGFFYGDTMAVFNCMDWNLTDTVDFLNKNMETVVASGNDLKFAGCRDHCSIRACSRIENYYAPWTTDHYGIVDLDRFDPLLPRTTVVFEGGYPGLASFHFQAWDREWFTECNFAANEIAPEYRMPPTEGTAWEYCVRMCEGAPIDRYPADFGIVDEFNDMFFCQYHLNHPDPCYRNPSSYAMDCLAASTVSQCRTSCSRLNECRLAFRRSLSDWSAPRHEPYYTDFCQDRYAAPTVPIEGICGTLEACGDVASCGSCDPTLDPDALAACEAAVSACTAVIIACQDAWQLCVDDNQDDVDAGVAREARVQEFLTRLRREADDDVALRNQTAIFFDGVNELKDTAESLSCHADFHDDPAAVDCGSIEDCGECECGTAHGGAMAGDDTRPVPHGPVTFDPGDLDMSRVPREVGGFVQVEAESFYLQTRAGVRRWYRKPGPDVLPDPDPFHPGASRFYLELLPDTRVTHDDPLILGVNFTPEGGHMAVLTYPIYFNNPGRYYVWVRAYSTGTEDNGLHAGINDRWPASSRHMQWCQKNRWRWASKKKVPGACGGARPPLIHVDVPVAGLHEIMFSMRGDGFEFDAFLLTSDIEYRPPGAEPDVMPPPAASCPVCACKAAWESCVRGHFTGAGDTYYERIITATAVAENHMAKIGFRKQFFDALRPEVMSVIIIFGEATDRFSEFLDNTTPFIQRPQGSEFRLAPDGSEGYLHPERQRMVRWWMDGGYSSGAATINVYEEAGRDVFSPYGVDSPAELLIAERFRQDLPTEIKDNTASVGIYVWRGPDMKIDSPRYIGGEPTRMGYVHAAKVEVRAPKRCYARCNLAGTGPEGWPWIRTRTRRFRTKRCFYLMDYQGMTKARVIRYDEPMAETKPLFRFGNNILIRGLKTGHPDVAQSSSAAVQNVFNVCAAQIHPHISGVARRMALESSENPQYLEHAFMLNYVPDPDVDDRVDDRYLDCWRYVHQHLLEKGVHSESCAQYYWQDGMNIRFAPCDAVFSAGHM